ncbi:hypothetical protein [Mixta calida]|uniref:hypothetical protein n=1 Tax=Mixta calida TaxID=665913 RepID=UPI00289E9FD0|nr:hypothetical protein [Mixta calida]MBS6056507.1 hypothetical protein [Pantoea sp.]MDU5189662.1 hypothetical protein [Mixta calida]
MRLPPNLMIIDSVPRNKWFTATEIKYLVGGKYGSVHLSVITSTLHRMADSVNVKLLKKGNPRKLQYRLVSVGEDYIIRNVRQVDKELLPDWMKKLAEPKKTYPAGFLMAEFNKLIREVRHA